MYELPRDEREGEGGRERERQIESEIGRARKRERERYSITMYELSRDEGWREGEREGGREGGSEREREGGGEGGFKTDREELLPSQCTGCLAKCVCAHVCVCARLRYVRVRACVHTCLRVWMCGSGCSVGVDVSSAVRLEQKHCRLNFAQPCAGLRCILAQRLGVQTRQYTTPTKSHACSYACAQR
jgi:hypothetical protein